MAENLRKSKYSDTIILKKMEPYRFTFSQDRHGLDPVFHLSLSVPICGSMLLLFFLLALVGAVSGQDRKEFRSDEYQFSASYSADWTVTLQKDYKNYADEKSRVSPGIVIFQSPVVMDDDQRNAASIIICSQPVNRSLLLDDNCHRRDDHLSDLYKNTTVSRKKIIIDGIEAERTDTKRYYEDRYDYYVSFATKNRKFFITGTFNKSTNPVWDTFKYEPEFNRLIESIKLIGEK